MLPDDLDVLMITFNRPHYTELALSSLLNNSSKSTRVWVWHNGTDQKTLEVVHSFRQHLHNFHHSRENVHLTMPTNWLYKNAEGRFLSKVDDDCIVPPRWDATLIHAHKDEPRFGVIGCWRFQEEDFFPEIASKKIHKFKNGRQLLVNFWVEGSGYVIKRECVDALGILKHNQSFTDYCINVARAGWTNGWLYPFLYQEHMDDPRAANSALKKDSDLKQFLPLSARRNSVDSLSEWTAQLRRSALLAQQAPIDPTYWSPTRRKLRNLKHRARSLLSKKSRLW